MLTIPLQQIAAIIAAARDCEVEEKALARADRKSGAERRDRESDATPEADRLLDLVADLTSTELNELVALAWMGRGDFEPEAFPAALQQATKIISTHPAEYVARLPGLADYLRSALTSLGYRVESIREPD
ncbi:MAG TPA: DUF3775 domain-containing protein [Stellaceae bacterium]|nr:DUF3775 domain-containing protein [Stellaceae bacterium]